MLPLELITIITSAHVILTLDPYQAFGYSVSENKPKRLEQVFRACDQSKRPRKRGERRNEEKGAKTYLAFNKLKYNVHAIPQVLWKGTLY